MIGAQACAGAQAGGGPMSYALVIAAKGGKRSRAAGEVVDALRAHGLRVGGFTQRTVESGSGVKSIELVRIRDGTVLVLARSAAVGSGADPSACSFSFDRAAFDAARGWLDADAPGSDVLVLDGLGRLELGGEGHRASIAHALADGPPVVLAVRDDQLVYAFEALGLGEPVAAYTDGSGQAELAAFVAEVARAAARER